MQAITTKYLGATNFRGARVKATCQAGSITVSWDCAGNVDENHDLAARALIVKLGWNADCYEQWHRGALPDGTGNEYVNAHPRECLTVSRKAT